MEILLAFAIGCAGAWASSRELHHRYVPRHRRP